MSITLRTIWPNEIHKRSMKFFFLQMVYEIDSNKMTMCPVNKAYSGKNYDMPIHLRNQK